MLTMIIFMMKRKYFKWSKKMLWKQKFLVYPLQTIEQVYLYQILFNRFLAQFKPILATKPVDLLTPWWYKKRYVNTGFDRHTDPLAHARIAQKDKV